MQSSPNSIFLSYRRSDSQDVAGRIFDHLVEEFGRSRVFKDVDSIPIASDFRKHIVEQIAQSVVVVLIGPTWPSSRLSDSGDYVRLEIETAIESGVPIVPVLVTNARMPDAREVPATIQQIVQLNAIAVRPDPDFRTDIARLKIGLRGFIPAEPSRQAPDSTLLIELQKACQDWHNQIVETIAKILAVLSDATIPIAERQRAIWQVNFVYENTRTYLPKVLAGRRALSGMAGTSGLASAVDDFLSLVVKGVNDETGSAYCRPSHDWVFLPPELRPPDRFGTGILGDKERRPEFRYAEDVLNLRVSRASLALERIAHEVAALTRPE